jgi:hypothetical protein
MNNQLRTHIDNIIRTFNENYNSYDLEIGCDLDDKEQNILINLILQYDPENIKSVMLDYAQMLINERKLKVECLDRFPYAGGF